MVRATLRMSRVLISLALSPRLAPMTPSNGAWLNHTKKVIKNAIQLKCSTFILPVKENNLMPAGELIIALQKYQYY